MIAGVCAMLVCSSSAVFAGVGAAAKPSSASAPVATMRPKENRAPRVDAVAVIMNVSPHLCLMGRRIAAADFRRRILSIPMQAGEYDRPRKRAYLKRSRLKRSRARRASLERSMHPRQPRAALVALFDMRVAGGDARLCHDDMLAIRSQQISDLFVVMIELLNQHCQHLDSRRSHAVSPHHFRRERGDI